MSSFSLLLDAGMLPFTGALMLVAGFLLVELLFSLVGASLMGDGADVDGPDLDGAAEFDLADMDGVDGVDPDSAEVQGADVSAAGGLAAWLGFGQIPFILWLSGLLTAFGVLGYVLQLGAHALLGASLSWPLAAAIAAVPSLRIGASFARLLGRLVPKTESSAIKRRSLGGRRGVVVQGTARRGKPAQARVRDGFGNWHYVRVEPLDDDVAIPARTEVMIRDGRGPVLLAIPIEDIHI